MTSPFHFPVSSYPGVHPFIPQNEIMDTVQEHLSNFHGIRAVPQPQTHYGSANFKLSGSWNGLKVKDTTMYNGPGTEGETVWVPPSMQVTNYLGKPLHDPVHVTSDEDVRNFLDQNLHYYEDH